MDHTQLCCCYMYMYVVQFPDYIRLYHRPYSIIELLFKLKDDKDINTISISLKISLNSFLPLPQLTYQPTPIHEWAVPGVASGFQLHIKRDDLTGSTLTGNKVGS